jgi:hypothetical protein
LGGDVHDEAAVKGRRVDPALEFRIAPLAADVVREDAASRQDDRPGHGFDM